jgi:hypothetical protein
MREPPTSYMTLMNIFYIFVKSVIVVLVLGQVSLHSPHRDGHQAGGIRDAHTLRRVHRPGRVLVPHPPTLTQMSELKF